MQVSSTWDQEGVELKVFIPWHEVHDIDCKGSLEDYQEVQITEHIFDIFGDVDIEWDEDTGEAIKVTEL